MRQQRQFRKPEKNDFLARVLDKDTELYRHQVLAEVQRLEREISRLWKIIDDERRLQEQLKAEHANEIADLLEAMEYYRKTNKWLWKLKNPAGT